jgi:hypothetical protein
LNNKTSGGKWLKSGEAAGGGHVWLVGGGWISPPGSHIVAHPLRLTPTSPCQFTTCNRRALR